MDVQSAGQAIGRGGMVRRGEKAMMTRRLVVACVVAATIGAMPAAVAAGNPPDPFVGSYRSTDSDGSHQLLAFGASGSGRYAGYRAVLYLDDSATVCGGDRAIAKGVGAIDGASIGVVFEVSCRDVADHVADDYIVFAFDQSAGTLTDTYGIVWTRP
jgi:hypothetical protein